MSQSLPTFRSLLAPSFDNPNPKNGVELRQKNNAYREAPGISPSDVKIASEDMGDFRSRGHLTKLARDKMVRYCRKHQVDPPPGMYIPERKAHLNFGTLYHQMLLEPDTFDTRYFILDDQVKQEIIAKRKERKKASDKYPTDFNPRWKESIENKKIAGRDLNDAEKAFILKERQASFLAEADEFNPRCPEYLTFLDDNQNAGKTLATQGDVAHAQAMIDSLYSFKENTEVGGLIKQLTSEKDCLIEPSLYYSHTYRNGLTLQAKGRPDVLAGDAIFDPKTTLCAHPEIFTKEAEIRGYDFSIAFYFWLTHMLAGSPDGQAHNFPKTRVGFLVQEKEPPYLARTRWLPDDWLKLKVHHVQHQLSKIATAWSKGDWSSDFMIDQETTMLPSRYLENEIQFFEENAPALLA